MGWQGRRAAHVDRMILACFVLGLSHPQGGDGASAHPRPAGQRRDGEPGGQVARSSGGRLHRRPLQDAYKALFLDGVVLSRKTGAGALKRPVLVALGIRPDGRREVIDFRLAGSESAAEWERFLTDLYRRGLAGKRLDMICVDGGPGLIAALPTVYPDVPAQRCWAHKIRNVLNKVRVADQRAVKPACMPS